MTVSGTYSINDLERLTGIKAHTIRMWEKRYGIMDPGRSNGGIRRYCDEDLRHMLNISILRQKGYKISQIASFPPKELHEKVSEDLGNSGDRRIEGMILSMLILNEEGFRDELQNSITEHGLEETFSQVLYPFFERIGVMWLAGTINPAQEHFVSNIVRQKLIVAINSLEKTRDPEARRFLLFLPEGEMHEIGLLLYTYMIKKSGHKVYYLGQSTPLGCVKNVMESQGADVLLTSVTSALSGDALTEYLEKIPEEFPGLPILLSGLQIWKDGNIIPDHPDLIRLAGLESIKLFLSDLTEQAAS